MASRSETGHAKNVANFDELISFINGYGAAYNPSKASIKVAALRTVATNAKNAVNVVNTALPPYKNAVADRMDAFAPLSKLVTRVLNSVIATDTSPQVIENVKTFTRKIQGRRAVPKKSDEELQVLAMEGKETRNISASQMSYDNRLYSLDKLIKFLTTLPLYKPNEADLKITALTTLYNGLQAKNVVVLAAVTSLSNARLTRNDIMYKDNTGLVSLANESKTYAKSLFGVKSPQYRQISKLQFKPVKL